MMDVGYCVDCDYDLHICPDCGRSADHDEHVCEGCAHFDYDPEADR